jgi:hypothetical protein
MDSGWRTLHVTKNARAKEAQATMTGSVREVKKKWAEWRGVEARYETDSVNLLADIEKDPDTSQGKEKAGAAGGDEGQRDALGGQEREDDADVEESLQENGGGDSEGGEARKGISGSVSGSKTAVSENNEEGEDGNGSDEAKFFRDIGVDEIGVGFGEIEELLHAFHVAPSSETTGPDSDEGLVDVKSGALGIEFGVQKGQHARAAPRHPEEQCGQGGRSGGESEEEILEIHPGEDEHHG